MKDAARADGRGGEASEHRLHPHRRSSWNLVNRQFAPHIVELEQRGRDVQQLLRRRLAVLPVALDDLHRPVPARHEGRDEPASGRRLPEVPVGAPGQEDVRGRAAVGAATRPRCSAST